MRSGKFSVDTGSASLKQSGIKHIDIVHCAEKNLRADFLDLGSLSPDECNDNVIFNEQMTKTELQLIIPHLKDEALTIIIRSVQ